MFSIGVFAIIFSEQKEVLFCHRCDKDLWNLPGGGLEPGEAPWKGIIREVKEETGLDVKIDYLQGVYFKPEKNELIFSFVCKIVAGQLTKNDEADRFDYFSLENIPNNSLDKQIERIKDCLSNSELTMKNQYNK